MVVVKGKMVAEVVKELKNKAAVSFRNANVLATPGSRLKQGTKPDARRIRIYVR